jgi:hypothetical protein
MCVIILTLMSETLPVVVFLERTLERFLILASAPLFNEQLQNDSNQLKSKSVDNFQFTQGKLVSAAPLCVALSPGGRKPREM